MAWRWRKAASEPAIQVAGFALLVILAVWIVLAHSLWVLRDEAVNNARHGTGALAQSLEGQISASLENARLILGRTADGVALRGFPDTPHDPAVLSRMIRTIDGVAHISGLGIFPADGIIRHAVVRDAAGTFGGVPYMMDVNDRDYVMSMDRHPANTLFVGVPVQSRGGGQWVLPVSRPIRDAVGALGGGVVALIDIETLITLFERQRNDPDTQVSLVRNDGVLLARVPAEPALIGQSLGGGAAVDAGLLRAGQPVVRQVVDASGAEVIEAVVPDGRFPFHLMVRVPMARALADWTQDLWRSVFIGGAVAAVVLALALALAGQWRRRQRVDAALQQSRQALTASLQRFERAVAGSTAALWEFDLRTEEGYLAPQWQDLMGWADDGDAYRLWRSNLHPADRDRVLAEMRAHLETRVPFDTEYRLRAADGSWRWVKARGQATWDADGRATIMSGTVHDVTDLRRSKERLRLALEATHDGLWDWDLPTGHLFLSAPWKTMLGYAPNAAMAPNIRTVLRLIHPADRPAVLAWMRSFLCAGSDTGEMEYRLRRTDGSWIWVRAAIKVTERSVDGRPLRVVGTHQDVSPRREELRQLEEARRQAEEGSRAKSEFLATMSHELRTPLNAISGFSESLECQFFGPLNDKQAEYIRDIRSSAEHLTSLINDILDMAKIEAGHVDLAEEPVDVAAVVRAKIQMLRQRAEQKGVELIEDLEPLPPYLLDPRRLGQIMLNLLSNAVKFTPAGGAVTVRAMTEPDGTLSLAVIDTGIGIAEEDIDRVLEPFTQVDSRLSREYEGTGLGLPLVKAMAEMHGGTFCLSSSLGRGTTAIVAFPAHRRLRQDARQPVATA
ncbi:PAS domain-containing protein [Novispirillum sp. DQ9]|uniref:PAS domain-containing protein n=1 Tax=Novispirillum sp. DQ9 TaxID=3398612 RepID=UPI003C7E4E3F